MRPYEELCRVSSVTDLKIIKAILAKHHIEYFIKGDPFDRILLHLKDAMHVMVKYDEISKAKRILTKAA